MIGIYKITNLINEKVYIGQSKNIEQRWRAHRTRYQTEDYPLYRAMRKYCIESFSFEVLEECQIEELNDKEIYWIQYYDSHNPNKGYNLTDGGSSPSKTILTEEEVLEIYTLLETSMTMEDIAKKYDISYHTISDINTGVTWVHPNISYPIRERYKLAKKNTKEYYCIDCGAQISRRSIRCSKCAGKARHQNKVTREELKCLIRTKTFVDIGKMFGVSDNAIRKWCKGFELPYKKAEIKKYTNEEWEKV